MFRPLISVIIPFYSGEKWLDEAIDSVINQTYKNFEIILVNDGSKEDINKLLEKYGDKIRYFYQENKGAAVARNKGIEISKGAYIAFLDSDDLWMEQKLEIQIGEMLKHKAYWSHTNYLKFGSCGNESIVESSNFCGDVYPLSIISNPIATPTVMIKKDLFEQNRSFRFAEGIKFGEDTILWANISRKYNLISIDKELSKIRIRGTNASLTVSSQIFGRAKIYEYISKENFNIPILTKLGYKICYKLSNIDCVKYFVNKSVFISKVLYIIPWSFFKIDKYLYCINRR